MSLEAGTYQIRFVPRHIHLPFVGGSYATGEGINAPIRAEALGPHGETRWNVEPVHGKPGTYTITALPPVLPKAGWSFRQNRGPSELIILAVDNITEWVLVEVDAKNHVYEVQEPTKLIGAVHAVTEENRLVLLKSYPVIEHMPPLPRWQFNLVN